MTIWNHYANPYNSFTWVNGAERPKVTLARIPGAEQGARYSTVPFTMETNARGDHMKRRVKHRAVRREGAA